MEVGDDFKMRALKKEKRKTIRTKVNLNLVGYDAWRSPDRMLIQSSPNSHAVCKILVPPALLKKAFGSPDFSRIGFNGSGCFDFEDTNLDLYRLYDYKKTDLYHGLNREDSYYLNLKNMKKPIHKRLKKWPSFEEFWSSSDPVEFRLLASKNSEWQKFRRWLRRHL